ncbi:hypothetical protein M3J09_013382 [Ascochyta lentis]
MRHVVASKHAKGPRLHRNVNDRDPVTMALPFARLTSSPTHPSNKHCHKRRLSANNLPMPTLHIMVASSHAIAFHFGFPLPLQRKLAARLSQALSIMHVCLLSIVPDHDGRACMDRVPHPKWVAWQRRETAWETNMFISVARFGCHDYIHTNIHTSRPVYASYVPARPVACTYLSIRQPPYQRSAPRHIPRSVRPVLLVDLTLLLSHARKGRCIVDSAS